MTRKFFAISAFIMLLSLAGGIAVGNLVKAYTEPPEPLPHEIRLSSKGLTSPLLECETTEPEEARERTMYFNLELKEKVQEIEARPGIGKIGVYFRDLENGPIVGVNMDESFIPASLAKLPLLVACLKMSEFSPAFLDKKVQFKGVPSDWLKTYHFPPRKTLEVGKEYTVWEMLEYTIEFSDNAAAYVLWETLPQDVMDNVLTDMGFNCHVESCRVSPSSFARYFRVLYNGSYLNATNSEKALQLLSKCEFKEGLTQGLPLGTTVAHKFGEIFRKSEGKKRLQLHDCGIVYIPGSPYILCIMTGGSEYEPLQQAIGEISQFVYEQVERNTFVNESLLPQYANVR